MASAPTPDERDSRPPMSTTSLPETPTDPPPSPVNPPILASDILMEDVAPHHPAANILRTALGFVALSFAALGVLDVTGALKAAGAGGEWTMATVAAVLMVFPLPYVTRATLAALLGLVPLAIGACSLPETAWHRVAIGLLAAVLPCVFFFRARYRALAAARVVLAVAFVIAAPGLLFAVSSALDANAPLVLRVVDGALVAGALAGAFGFMGAETTGMCGVWASTTILLVAAHVATVASTAGWRVAISSAVIGAGCCTLVALAGFQLLATVFANAARRVDIHRPVMESSSAFTD